MVMIPGSWYGNDEADSAVDPAMVQAEAKEKTIREAGIRHEACTQGRRIGTRIILGAAPVRECLGISRRRLAECLVLFGIDVTRQPTRGGRRAGASFDLFPGAPQLRTAECAPAGPTTHATTGNTARKQQLHDLQHHHQITDIEYRPARLLLPHTAHFWAALMLTPREHGAA
jgi:hypothetical protein